MKRIKALNHYYDLMTMAAQYERDAKLPMLAHDCRELAQGIVKRFYLTDDEIHKGHVASEWLIIP